MIDIHTHILPGLDDGAKSLEEAVAMVHMAAAAGTTDIVATPHANHQYRFDPVIVEQKIAEVREASGNVVRIHRGCDFHMSVENISDALENPAKYAINGKGYVLIEFSNFNIPPAIEGILDDMLASGITPVITHPERNSLLHSRLSQIQRWVANDCTVQITAQSLLGRFGKAAKAFADQLLRKNLVHFVASDAHDTEWRPPILTEAYSCVRKEYGDSEAERLFVSNPMAVIQGEPLAITRSPKTKWYHRITS